MPSAHGCRRSLQPKIKSCKSHLENLFPCQFLSAQSASNLDLNMGALKMQDKTLQDRTMTDKRSTMPE